ncbi:sugar transferase [Fimbriiglobus ruber]|uniref:Lipid carrier: UDP-N-acetylgalactosaminyltransferase n=1 Tax=Fimbriiglobus ruber TaxID=1908690 RepID=A0A225CXV5_9BACT|nr:sugar transferase [Fimbriiglobus ruber]OWK34161.1 Lipid carrier : UDP-N-acetylgalactosaminyltransferase [Fimbriiglobus ruber]
MTTNNQRRQPTLWCLTQRLIAFAMLVLLAPLLAVMYLVVRLTSRGPFLYCQTRPGLGGQPFTVWKVRTMTVGSDRDVKNAFAVTKNNTQVTAVGRILRDLKLDELPQLWNVVRGEMCFVGPRPIAPALHEKLCRELPGFARRLDVPPGLTNVGQVCVYDNADGDKLVEDWRLRLEADLHYIRHRSVWYDLVLVGVTAMFMARKLVRRVLPSRGRKSVGVPAGAHA